MKICMMTNTYLPHVGGVARSVSTFAETYRQLGHRVLVIAPEFKGRPPAPRHEEIVQRVPAIQNFNGSDFAVRLPLATGLSARVTAFHADLIHAHHPFLLGDTALRVATRQDVPLVFTHHTRYEDYTHYVPFDSPAMKEIAIGMKTQYANLCDGVIAPSESIAQLIRTRGVKTPVAVVPTGVDLGAFAAGGRGAGRRRHGVPARAFVVGWVGRLAPEKNLPYLAEAVARFLQPAPDARFLVVGSGPAEATLRQVAAAHGVAAQVIFTGNRTGRALQDAYRAMDVFAFASFSETQGLVLAEAMAAGLPAVALQAPGVREVVRNGRNGFLLPARTPPVRFAAALSRLHRDRELRRTLAAGARATAREFSREACAARALAFYAEVRRARRHRPGPAAANPWSRLLQRVGTEWLLLSQKTSAVVSALSGGPEARAS